MPKLVFFATFVLCAAFAAYFVIDTAVFLKTEPAPSESVTSVQSREIQAVNFQNKTSARVTTTSASALLPIPGSAPTQNVKHSIPIDEIRQGCFRQDCIPSIQDPKFITPIAASEILEEDSLGIALHFNNESRFYPFPMLETRELVNDVIDGEPVLISYCPLCGTGIVFNRRVGAEVLEFGVSGMLWQSNLLMYNRTEKLEDRNLWSQVLGEAVVGDKTGTKLAIIPSDIQQFSEWIAENPDGIVLDSGIDADPYNGEYFSVAQNFRPNFDLTTSPLAPMTYVYGIEVNGKHKAYPRDLLPEGEMVDVFNGEEIIISKEGQTVQFLDSAKELIPDVEGFWFSWIAAHPESELWSN